MNYYGFSPIYTQIPNTAIYTNNRAVLVEYWKKYLMEKAVSVYDWKIPKLWSENYFKYILYNVGFISIIYTAEFGWIPQRCAVGGLNLFEEPDTIIVNNPIINGIERKIGDGCVLFKFNPDYTGVADIIEYYAMQLSELSLTAYANMITTKVGYIISVPDKKTADSAKRIVDSVLNGEPATISKDSKTPNSIEYFSQNVKQNYIVSDIIIDMRKLLQSFNTEFGIPNSNTEKKERMIKDEVNSNNVETFIKSEMWLNSFKNTCEELNSMAGYDIMDVDWAKCIKESGY